jgi:hypothetical protein
LGNLSSEEDEEDDIDIVEKPTDARSDKKRGPGGKKATEEYIAETAEIADEWDQSPVESSNSLKRSGSGMTAFRMEVKRKREIRLEELKARREIKEREKRQARS